jgi:hypothetical protein
MGQVCAYFRHVVRLTKQGKVSKMAESKKTSRIPTFSIALKSTPVKLVDAQGKEINCVIKQVDGRGRDAYFTRFADKVIMDDKGKVIGMKSFEGSNSALLAQCLYNEEGVLVKEAIIQSWPASTLQKLFDIAQDLSDLKMDEAKKEEVKND